MVYGEGKRKREREDGTNRECMQKLSAKREKRGVSKRKESTAEGRVEKCLWE